MPFLNSLLPFSFIIAASPVFILSTCTLCTMIPATTTTPSLATQICKRTANFTFCRDVIFSDPRAAEADGYLLSAMAFRRAYATASDTHKYIELKLKEVVARGSHGPLTTGLRKCLGHYQEAVRALVEVMGDLDSDTFYGLDKLAAHVEGSARACEESVVGLYDVVRRNEELIKVANVCGALSKLYTYV